MTSSDRGSIPTSETGETHSVPHRGAVIGDGIAWLAKWSARWILIAIAAVLLGLVVKEFWTILLPIFLALVVASVLVQPAQLLERHLRFPPALAAASVLIGSFAIIVGIIVAIAPSVSNQAGNIGRDASKGLLELQTWVQDRNLISSEQLDTAIKAAQDRITSSGDTIASGVLSGVGAVTSTTVTLVITLILTFFFLKDGRRFTPLVRRVAGQDAGGHLAEVLHRGWVTLGSFIRTQALVSLIDAVFIGIGLLIVGVPLAIPLAILTFFGGFVPIVGAFVAGGIAVLVALVSNGWVGALIVLGIVLVVQQIEGNVLSPWLQSKSMDLHPAVVLLSVAFGSTVFGIIGAFMAVPVMAVAAVMLRYLDEIITLQSSAPLPLTMPGGASVPMPVTSEPDAPDPSAG